MKKIFINVCEERTWIKTSLFNQKAYKDLFDAHGISTYTYYVWTIDNKEWFIFQESFCCKNEKELIEKILRTYENNNVIFINTAVEWMIELCTEIKKLAWEPVTKEYTAFRDKSKQRDLLASYNQDLAIKYITVDHENIDINKVEATLDYPFIIKPSSWIQSAWVCIISSREELEIYLWEYSDFLLKFSSRAFDTNLLENNSTLICEEFLDGKMFSVDYFVDKNGKSTTTPVVDVKIWQDIWIKDFMNYARSFREKVITEIEDYKINNLIETTIKAIWIKNTFIHHEFKLTSTGQLKTIEINGRIWGYRTEMIQESLDLNWFSVVQWSTPRLKLKNNFCSFLIYPKRRGILKDFNQELFTDIEKLESIYVVNKIESFIWKEVWLTSQWFTKVAIIKIKNSDSTQFEKDYSFIEKNFKKLLILK